MAERKYYYEKYDDEFKSTNCPQDDKDGKITGKFVLNVIAYFDENPEERIRLGWIKHITHDPDDPEEGIEYNRQTQFVVKSVRQVDDYTLEDVYHVLDKSEEQLALEEMLAVASWGSEGITFF